MKEIYVSVDVETNGPIPGKYSLLSLAAVAFNTNGKIIGQFYKKLKPLPNASKHPKTMDWWKENKSAYDEATSCAENPLIVMNDFYVWLGNIEKEKKAIPIFLGWPLGFDYMFVYWYLVNFVKDFEEKGIFEIPFCYNRTIDVISYVMGRTGKNYLTSRQPNTYKKLITNFDGFSSSSHTAIKDAIRQGNMFIQMLKEKGKLRK